MGTQATLVYTVKAVGTSSALIQPFVAAAPIPRDVLTALGLRVLSDTISAPAVNPVVRTVVLGFGPSAPAVLHLPTFIANGGIKGVSIAAKGNDFIVPPIIRADDNDRTIPLFKMVDASRVNLRPVNENANLESWLDVHDVTILAPGGGYVGPTTCAFLGGLPPAGFDFTGRGGAVRYINVADPGFGYPIASVLAFLGGNPVKPAQGVVTFDPITGAVKSIVVTDMGLGYQSVPQPVIICPLGGQPRRAAELFAAMAEGRPAQGTVTVVGNQVTGIVVTDAGDNYVEPPDVAIYDPAGLGALADQPHMEVGRVDVIDPGAFYGPNTTFTVTPAFEDYFPPPNSNQAEPFFQLLQATIQQFAITPVVSTAPVVA